MSPVHTVPNALSETRYYVYDGGGSVRALTDESGAITDTWDYDAFGNLLGRTGESDNAYLYRGEQYDADLGQYYLCARFYNQSTGRFWNQDSYEGATSEPASLHKYLYAHSDPVNGIDPSGMFLQSTLLDLSARAFLLTTRIAVTFPRVVAFVRATTAILTIVSLATDEGRMAFLATGNPAAASAALADDAAYLIFRGASLVRQAASTTARLSILSQLSPRMSSASQRIQAVAGDAVVGIRGSLQSGVRYDKVARAPGDSFNPASYDADAFIISDDLAARIPKVRGFRDGRHIPEIAREADALEEFLKAIPGYGKGDGKVFTFRVYTAEEAARIGAEPL